MAPGLLQGSILGEPVLGHRPNQTGLDMSLNCPTVYQTSVPCAVSSHAFRK
ncbi:hypothetical protein J6590_065356 [Homalodisca vitripennis]|nr:hypothetical protein J6590_065356 [Homalodisca vitripennis]